MITHETIAKVCHEANRAWCEVLGDMSQPRWEDAPDWQRDSAISGVRVYAEARVKGMNPDSPSQYEQSHNGWLEEKLRAGWTYGPVKDPDKKQHPCMLPYSSLPIEQKLKDHLFISICAAMYFASCHKQQ